MNVHRTMIGGPINHFFLCLQFVLGPLKEVRTGPGSTHSLLPRSLEQKIQVKQGTFFIDSQIFQIDFSDSIFGPRQMGGVRWTGGGEVEAI